MFDLKNLPSLSAIALLLDRVCSSLYKPCFFFSFLSLGSLGQAESTLQGLRQDGVGVNTCSFDHDFTLSSGDRFHVSFLALSHEACN